MVRGTTARHLLSVLAAVLLSLQLLGPAEAFASVHTSETISCDDTEHPRRTALPLGTRDRGRGDKPAPPAPVRGDLGRDPAASCTPPALPADHHRPSRSSTSHTPAALQVFRC
ncbi:hypothetical protein ACFV6E_11060 [Streptomyces sp. NPDC059785]|uniref:hypothetical protein n=1 Tax=unclassified Streptomyces TaxID=2593676 RepID=UPI0036699A05